MFTNYFVNNLNILPNPLFKFIIKIQILIYLYKVTNAQKKRIVIRKLLHKNSNILINIVVQFLLFSISSITLNK